MKILSRIFYLFFLSSLISCGLSSQNFNKQKHTKLKHIQASSSEEDEAETDFQPKTFLFNEADKVELKIEVDKEVDFVLIEEMDQSAQIMPSTDIDFTDSIETEVVQIRVNKEKISQQKRIAHRNKKMKKYLLVFLITIGFLAAISLGTFGLFWIAWGRGLIGALMMITAIIGIILLFSEIKKMRKGEDKESSPKRRKSVWVTIISISIVLLLLAILL